jgi:hypothetical protein
VLKAELDEAYSDFVISCVDSSGLSSSGDVSADASWRIHKILTELRSEFAENTAQTWRKCTFTVLEDGKFKLDVEY